MKTIKSLELNNFGPFKHEVIEFSKLHAIRGANSVGKTMGVYNALETILLNEDFPEQFINHNAKEASIKVNFSDGSSIYRERKGNKQSLLLINSDWTTHFEAKEKVSDCDDIVRAFTHFDTISFDGGKTKESLQFVAIDAPQTYLIAGLSPENVLKRLSTIMCGGQLEQVLQRLNSKVKENAKELSLRQEDLKQLHESQRITFENFTSAEAKTRDLEMAQKNAQTAQQTFEVLKTLIETFNTLTGVGELYSAAQSVASKLDEADKIRDKRINCEADINRLTALVDKVNRIESVDVNETTWDTINTLLKALATRQLNIQSYVRQLQQARLFADEYGMLVSQIEDLETAKLDIEQEIKDYKEIAPVCATCGKPL